MKTILLDFDGCTHPAHHDVKDRFNRVDLLDECLRPFASKVEIVVSSSWRFEYSPSELKALLPKGLGKLMVNVTGAAHIGAHARYNEITRYVKDYGVKDWVAIDDSGFEFPKDHPRLILCNSSVGIDIPQLKQLEDWLRL